MLEYNLGQIDLRLHSRMQADQRTFRPKQAASCADPLLEGRVFAIPRTAWLQLLIERLRTAQIYEYSHMPTSMPRGF